VLYFINPKRNSMNKRTISSRLAGYRAMIHGAVGISSIKKKLRQYGYTDEVLAEGQELLADTENLFTEQANEYTESYEAQEAFENIRSEVEDEFHTLYHVTKIALRKHTSMNSVLPPSSDTVPYKNWIATTEKFYNSLAGSSTALNIVAKRGISAEQVQNAITRLNHMETVRLKRDVENGQAQTKTGERNEKLEELHLYCADLRDIAKVAFKDAPQNLEQLGLIIRSN